MVSRRSRASIVASVSDPLTPALAAIAKAVPPGDVPEFRKRFYEFLRRFHQSSVAPQPRKKKMMAQDPTADQVNGKRRHAKRVWSDYYTGDENARNKAEGNGDADNHSRRHSAGRGRDSLETPNRARSPSRVAPKSAPSALPDPHVGGDNPHARGYQSARKLDSGGANPYAKSYGKEGPTPKQGPKPVARVNSAASLKGGRGGSGAKPNHRPKGGSSSTQNTAADHLAANTRALLNETDAAEVDPEHEAGESFWRSLVPCFRLICPEDAKALQSRGIDPAKDPMLRKCPLGLDYSLRWAMEDMIDLEGLDEHLEAVQAPISAEQLTECALSGLTGNPQLCGKRAAPVSEQQGAVSDGLATDDPTTATAGSELPVSISDKEENLEVAAPAEELARGTSVESVSVGPKAALVAGAQDEIMEDLVFLQQQLRTTVVCNDASRSRLRKCATAAMQRQQLLWRKWRYWYEVDRHYRWRQRMSQVHKLIIKNRTNKKDSRKASDRCVVSDLNHVDKHLAEYAHGWRPEQRATELDENLDLESVDQMLQNLKDREQVPPNVAKQLELAQEATQKDFGLVRHHLHDTLQLLCNTLHREIVKKELVAVEMQSLEPRVDIAQRNAAKAQQAAPKAQQQAAPMAVDDELCVQVGGHQNVSRQGGAKPSVVKPGQARPGQPLQASVAKPGQPRPGSHRVDLDPLKPCVSLSFMEALCVGEKVDCLDCENRWGRGMVQQVFEDGVLIHWEGFKKALDEKVLFVEHLRCTKSGTHIPEKAEPKPKNVPKASTKRGRYVEDVEDADDEVPSKVPKTESQEDLNGRSRRCSSIYRR